MNIDRDELLYRTLRNQHLLQKVPKARVASDLCGLQAQFASNPQYALRIRASDYSDGGWGEGLVKVWTLRGTLHAVRADELGLFLSARGRPEGWEDNGWNIPKAVKPYWSAFILEQLAGGVQGREELKEACRRRGMDEELLGRVFHGWGGLLKEMSDRGMIAYDIGTAKRFVPCGPVEWMDRREAQARLVRRYFKTFAPATLADCAAFLQINRTEIRRLTQEYAIPLETLRCGDTEYFGLREEADGVVFAGDIPKCLFLAGFDQMIMGYRDRSRIMDGADQRNVITVSGIVFPTVILEGRLRARWKKDGDRLLVTPFRLLSQKNRARIAAAGRRLFAGGVRDVAFQD